MAKFRSPQIKDGAINTNHLVSGIVVNNILLSKGADNAGQNVTFTVLNTLTLSGTDNVTYDLDQLFHKSGGTITGSLTVTGTITASGGLTVPSGASFTVSNGTSTVSGADLIQALAGVASSGLTVTAANLKKLTDGSDASALHTHTAASLNIKETRAISKVASMANDTVTTNFGNAANFAIPSGSSASASDIEVYLNGQMIEYGSTSNTYTWSTNGTTGTVTFNNSVSGDHLYVKWRAIDISGGSSSSGTTLSSGTTAGSGESAGNQANVSGSTSGSGTTLSSGTTTGSTSSGSTLAAPTNFTGTANYAYGSGPEIDWSWTTVQGMTYEYYIGATSVTEPPSTSTTSSHYVTSNGGVERGVQAKGWVRAKQGSEVSAWVTATATVPTFEAPTIRDALNIDQQRVTWWSVTGANSYEYQITTSSTPGSSWSTTSNTWLNSIDFSQFSAGATVYFFVRVAGSNNPYATSTVTIPASYAFPAVSGIGGTSTLVGGGTVSWSFSPVSGATQYEYLIGASSLAEPVDGQTPAPTTASVGSGIYDGGYVYYFYSNGGQPYTEGSTLRIWIRAKSASGVGPWATATHVI